MLLEIKVKEKECFKCKNIKSFDEFSGQKRNKDGKASWCKQCHREYTIRRQKENPEKMNVATMRWAKKNPEKVKATHRKRYVKDKKEIMSRLGNKCVCCGEAELEFLSLDHINNDGHLDRKVTGCSGVSFYAYLLRKVEFLEEKIKTLRILCMNCHISISKDVNSVCVHKRESKFK